MTTKTKAPSAQKKTAVKAATKTLTKPKTKSVPVVTVPAELAFWTVDGVVYHSLQELADGLVVMTGRVYRYHADKGHQDFANWVGSVFQNKSLATILKKATTPKAAEKIIRTHLKTVQK